MIAVLDCHQEENHSSCLSMLRRSCAILGFALCFIHLNPAEAIKEGHAVLEGFDALSQGKGHGFSINADGTLTPGPMVGNSVDLGAEQAWCVYRRADHTLFVGTAPDGRLLEVAESGALKTVAKVKEPAIYAVAGTADGRSIFFASSPDGKIYRMNPDGEPEVWFEPHEKYIWALFITPDGTLYAATGIHGKLYRITGKGTGQVWYTSTEPHLRSLAQDNDGNLLVGSANSGFLYKITGQEQALVIANSGRQEINQIAVDGTGSIYFTANGIGRPIPVEKPPLANMMDAAHALGGKPSPPANAPDEPIKDGADLFKLDKGLAPRLLWHGETSAHALLWTGSQAWVTSGGKGFAYIVSPQGDTAFTQLCDSSITAALSIDEHNSILLTSNPARLLRVSDAPTTDPALYDSNIIDTRTFARWGQLTVNGTSLDGVKISVRSGNTPDPDKTWFPWQTISLAANPNSQILGKCNALGARYAQVELKLPSPAVISRLDLAYLPLNRSPAVKAINILPPSVRYVPILLPDPQIPPKTPDQIDGGDIDLILHSIDKPIVRWVPQQLHGFRTLTWAAFDPDQDDLTYTLAYRAAASDTWHELATGLTDPLYSFDTVGWADGRYEIKVTANDDKENPPGEGLHDGLINRNLIVNNTPPTIIVNAPLDGKVQVEVSDVLSILKSVSLSSNGRDFEKLFPSDSILDSTKEEFSIPIKPGEILYIRAEDASGNVAGKQISG